MKYEEVSTYPRYSKVCALQAARLCDREKLHLMDQAVYLLERKAASKEHEHKDVRTTMIYTYVIDKGALGAKSPLDRL